MEDETRAHRPRFSRVVTALVNVFLKSQYLAALSVPACSKQLA